MTDIPAQRLDQSEESSESRVGRGRHAVRAKGGSLLDYNRRKRGGQKEREKGREKERGSIGEIERERGAEGESGG